MNNQERSLLSICEANVIVEGLKLLINRVDTQYSDNKNAEVYQAVSQFLQYVTAKYSPLTKCPISVDIEGNILLKTTSVKDLQICSAQDYINASLN